MAHEYEHFSSSQACVKVKVSFGLKSHSGWAALVVLGTEAGNLQVLDRRRIELVEDDGTEWAKQPYHAAEGKSSAEARSIVERGIESARRLSVREMQAAVKRAGEEGHHVAACAVLMTDPMPNWSVDEILAVHFRMHKAEGVLFREALARAARECRLELVTIQEKSLSDHAQTALGMSAGSLLKTVATLGKSIGPPWGRDQKDSALAAMVALRQSGA